jgi:hypothetical protein
VKTSVLLAGLLAAALNAGARDPKPADLILYAEGDSIVSATVYQTARATVSWMFLRVGVRVVWRAGKPRRDGRPGNPLTIQARFTREAPDGIGPAALAYASPFAGGGVAITILYDRVRHVAREPGFESRLLAHVLAHEIGHVLQISNRHSPAGVMKAHWSREDYEAMGRLPLEFTLFDVALIKAGLDTLVARTTHSSREAVQ